LDLATSADVVFLPSSFSFDDVAPTLRVIESLRNAGVPSARVAIVFCRTGGSKKQEQQARSVLEMNRIPVLDAVLPQKDGFISLYATGRTGREAPQPKLRSVALAMDEALLAFIEGASAPVPKLVANGGSF
jgi:chromosome partitioning protein